MFKGYRYSSLDALTATRQTLRQMIVSSAALHVATSDALYADLRSEVQDMEIRVIVVRVVNEMMSDAIVYMLSLSETGWRRLVNDIVSASNALKAGLI